MGEEEVREEAMEALGDAAGEGHSYLQEGGEEGKKGRQEGGKYSVGDGECAQE